jgi:DNA mismatch repair protein MutL
MLWCDWIRPVAKRVFRLDPLVAERIAAGEVVERPASAIKELVENSLDAGATRIEVELVNGGMTSMRVLDDGCGMSMEDAKLALERFATSKIRQWEDLDSLHTLGFRGEALPSICAVSRLEILTSETDAESGSLLRLEGGVLQEESACAAVAGTRVTVSDLFFNTPARLKFLKSPAAETSQVVDVLTRLALTKPGIHFQVRSNQREVLMIPAQMSLPQRLAQLWKVPLEDLVEVEGENGGVAVYGWVARPQHARATRSQQLFCINGRVIKSASLSQAVLEGFGPTLLRGRYPVALLQLTIEPSLIDVNVHPTKAEVRFADARAPFRAIYRSIASALEKNDVDTVQEQHWEMVAESPAPAYQGFPTSEPASAPPPEPWAPSPSRPTFAPRGPGHYQPAPSLTPAQASATLELFRPLPAGPRIKILSQLFHTFIVAEVDGELWLIDQHTAHERIWYEKLAHVQPLDSARQGLLVPELLEFTATQAAALEGALSDMNDFGFELEPFGGHTFQLRSLPIGVKPGKAAGILRSLVEDLSGEQISLRNHPKEAVRERLRAMMSCKAAVKAGDPLSQDEMEVLIRDMLGVEHSNYCPHGRPTRVKLDQRALERLFHRA